MTELGNVLVEYQAACVERGLDLRSYIAPGISEDSVRERLADAGLPAEPSVVEWFSFCGGVRKGSRTSGVFQGRAFNSLDEALGLLRRQDLDEPVDYGGYLPLTSDHPELLIELTTGAVVHDDMEVGRTPVAASLAAWVRDAIALLPAPGPLPNASRFAPVSITPGARELPRVAEYDIDQIVEYLSDRTVEHMWIESAPRFGKDDNDGLEPDQVALLVEKLVAGGIAAATDAEIFEGSQTSEGNHQLTVYFTEL